MDGSLKYIYATISGVSTKSDVKIRPMLVSCLIRATLQPHPFFSVLG